MKILSDSFLKSYKREDGFIIRGVNLTRLKTFVAAGFSYMSLYIIFPIFRRMRRKNEPTKE